MKKRQKTEAVVLVIFFAILLLGAIGQTVAIGQKYLKILVNGDKICAVAKNTDTEACIRNAKRQIMCTVDGYALMDAEITIEDSDVKFEHLITEKEAETQLVAALKDTMRKEKKQAYTVTSGAYSANFKSKEQAVEFLEKVKDHTEGGSGFEILLEDAGKARGAKRAEILSKNAKEETETQTINWTLSGVIADLQKIYATAEQKNLEEYQNQTGILAMEFADTVYGYENFVDADAFATVDTEVEEVTKEKETNTIYEVEAGDCLSLIAEKFDTTMESIVALNQLESEEATVYLDQELIVAVPRPDISLKVSSGIVYEEAYEEDPVIIPNESWYTTQQVVQQEGSEGHREVNALVTVENGLETERKILHTTVLAEAVPAVVEQGTVIPPTYIKPISGGRYTSGYGKRWGRMHKGVDWAVSVGTPVCASSAGTVSVAGAVRGYGYAVYINHPDGRQTRYGHLSKVLVSPGQSVSQGDRIALSGNTGRSTGPHLHFEILIDGSQVNPLNYMN